MKILLIDDETDFCKSLQTYARLKGFEISFYTNYDDGFKSLENEQVNYSGVILDARCYKNKNDETLRETKDSAVFYSINKIRELLNKINLHIPFCVNTGFSALFRDNIEAMGIMVFDKLKDRDTMLEWLREEIARIPENKIRSEFPDVFEVFRLGYLDRKSETILLKIIISLNKEYTDIEDFLFNPVRQILESLYRELNKFDDRLIPGAGINYERNKVNLTWCMLRLSNGAEFRDPVTKSLVVKSIEPPLPPALGSILHTVTKIVSTKSHADKSATHSYLIKSVVYGLLEILLWYKSYLKSIQK
jgi:hypothetical protein